MDNESKKIEIIKQYKSLAVPSAPIYFSTPILVKGTGNVDNEFYPIYDMNQSINNKHNNTNTNNLNSISNHNSNKNHKIDINNTIDSLDNTNDLYDDDDNSHNNHINISNKSEKEAINKWNISNKSELPYFIKPNQFILNENDDNNDANKCLLWVKGSKCSSESKAKDTIIYNAKELNIGDYIQFELNNNGIHAYQNRHAPTHNWWGPVYVPEIESGKGIVVNKSHCTYIQLGINNIVKLDCSYYNIIRLNISSKLFEIRYMNEIHLKTTCFIDICNEINIQIDWLSAYTILSFLQNDWQRNVYFNMKRFGNLVNETYKHFALNQDLKDLHTILNQLLPNALGTDRCYMNKIVHLATNNHLTFPNNEQRHEIYAKKPFLPKINSHQRNNMNIIRQRLNIGLNKDTKLYGYQLHTVCWAYNIEKSISSKQKLCIGSNDLKFANDINCPIYCLNYNHNDNESPKPLFIPSNINKILPPRLLSYEGGIIADDVGLGKSLTMLSLCLAHPYKDDITANYLFNNQTDEVIIGKNGKSFECASTLLIAPSHLIIQWKNEIIKHFKPYIFGMNIIMITTGCEHRKISYSDILSSSIVLVSAEFISGNHYQTIVNVSDNDWDNFLKPSLPKKPVNMKSMLNLRCRRDTRSSKRNNIKYQDLNQTTPCLHSFHWRRIILDEGHEYIDKVNIRDVIYNIPSDFCWYVTATPFTSDRIIAHVADFLDIRFDNGDIGVSDELYKYYDYPDWYKQLNKPLGNVLHLIIKNYLFSRHTKDSILYDNYLPNIHEKIEYVMFHPIEKLFYDIVKSRRGTGKQNINLERRICSGVLTHFDRYLDDNNVEFNEYYLMNLFNMNKIYYPIEVKQLKIELKNNNKIFYEYNELNNKVEIKKKEFKKDGRKFTLRDAFTNERTEKYQRIKQRLKSQQRKVQFTQNEIIRNEKEYKMIINSNINNKINEYIKYNFIQNKENECNESILLNIVQKYGAKQASLLKFIKKLHSNINNRIIIFSLFGQILNNLQHRLKKLDVSCVLCSGNVHIRKKAIKLFQDIQIQNNRRNYNKKQIDSRVILLSIESSASGANLNLATHIILVDPVPGTSSEAYAAERQAIGRAVRQGMNNTNVTKVIRFVVKDTIEEETYKRNKELRNKNENKNGLNELSLENKLKESLNGGRNQSEIEFYINIKDCNNKQKNFKKRKCMDNDDNICEMDDGDSDIEILNDDYKPPKKKRRID